MNISKLKGKIVENNLNVENLAKELGMDKSTLYRKLNNKGKSLTIEEANKIVETLNLSKEESMAIFFNSFVAYNANLKDKVF